MLRSEFMQEAMEARAARVKALAEFTAPVDVDDDHPGLYKASFELSSGVRAGKRGGRSRRAYGRVTNHAPYALDVEYGTRDTPRHRTLGRALEAAKRLI